MPPSTTSTTHHNGPPCACRGGSTPWRHPSSRPSRGPRRWGSSSRPSSEPRPWALAQAAPPRSRRPMRHQVTAAAPRRVSPHDGWQRRRAATSPRPSSDTVSSNPARTSTSMSTSRASTFVSGSQRAGRGMAGISARTASMSLMAPQSSSSVDGSRSMKIRANGQASSPRRRADPPPANWSTPSPPSR
jgi:hypothetical protein